MPGAAIIAPRGDVSEFGAARFFRRTGEGVYDMDDLAVRTKKMIGFVARASRLRRSRRPWSGSAIPTAPTYWPRCCLPIQSLFDAAVLMHPLIPFEPDIRGDLGGKRILITAGRRDPICPPDLTSRLEAHLRAGRADVTVEWHEGGHEVRPSEIEAAGRFLAPFAAAGASSRSI